MFRFHGISYLPPLCWILLSHPLGAEEFLYCGDVVVCKNIHMNAQKLENSGNYLAALAEYERADNAYADLQSGQHDPNLRKRIADMYKSMGHTEKACNLYAPLEQSRHLSAQELTDVHAAVTQCRTVSQTRPTAVPPTGKTVPVARHDAQPKVLGPSITTSIGMQFNQYSLTPPPSSAVPTATPPKPEGMQVGVDSESSKQPIYKKWWFWSAIGATTIGVIVIAAAVGRDNRTTYVW